MDHTNYYKVLQVDPDAEPEVVKAAYRALSRKYHPDGTHPSAERMKRLNDAYAVLSDPQTRARYNDEVARWGGDFSRAPASAMVVPPMRYQEETGDPPRARRPIRRYRFGIVTQLGLASFCLFLVVVSGVLIPRTQADLKPPTATPAIPVFQQDAEALRAAFEEQGFTFETANDPGGEPLMRGLDSQQLATVYIKQRGESVEYVSLLLPAGASESTSEQAVRARALTQLIDAAFAGDPGRDDAYDWTVTRQSIPVVDDSTVISGWLLRMWSLPEQQLIGIAIRATAP